MRCAIYCRLSREDEDKSREASESIINQQKMLEEYAANMGWEVIRAYCDEDYSGTDNTRPAFCSLLQDAEAKRFDVVLCKSQSRFARDIETSEKYIHGLFPLWGIRFIAVADGIDTENHSGKKARQITGLVNEWYLEDLSDSIRAVLDHKRREGIHIGSFAAYGYIRSTAQKGKLEIDQTAAQVVRQIFSWCIAGYGKQHIALMLNQKGVPNPTRYKQLCGFSYINGNQKNNLGLWSKTTVGRILCNEMYTGAMVQGKRKKAGYKSKKLLSTSSSQWFKVENTHPAIIDKETFLLAGRTLAMRKRSEKGGLAHPLAGRVFCSDCKSALTKTTSRHSYLHCRLNAVDSTRCFRHSIRLDRLIQLVSRQLNDEKKKLLNKADKIDLLAVTDNSRATEQLENSLQHQKLRIAQKEKALADLYIDKSSGVITAGQFESISRTISGELELLQKQSAEMTLRLSALDNNKKDCTDYIEGLLAFTLDNCSVAEIFIDRIEVGNRTNDGRQDVDIYWSF